MSKLQAMPEIVRRQLYLPWHLADDTSRLVPLYPFIQIDRHPKTGGDDLVVLIGQLPNGTMLWRSLTDMEISKDPARDAAARDVLRQPVRGRS